MVASLEVQLSTRRVDTDQKEKPPREIVPRGGSYRQIRAILPEVILLDFSATHNHVMHFIGTIGKAQMTHVCVHACERRPL